MTQTDSLNSKDLKEAPADEEGTPTKEIAIQGTRRPSPNFGRKDKSAGAYQEWPKRHLIHPDNLNLEELKEGLIDIVKVEGPVLCARVYRIYAEACGIYKVNSLLRKSLNKAMYRLIQDGQLLEENYYQIQNQVHKIVRYSGTAKVVVRSRGNRFYGDIPPSDWAAVMLQAETAHEKPLTDEERVQAALRFYGFGATEEVLPEPIEAALNLLKALV